MNSLIKDQLLSQLVSKGIINIHQHGFIAKHSTNLLVCTHNWSLAFHGKLSVDAIYIDFSMALDSVVPFKQIHKLQTLVQTDFF